MMGRVALPNAAWTRLLRESAKSTESESLRSFNLVKRKNSYFSIVFSQNHEGLSFRVNRTVAQGVH